MNKNKKALIDNHQELPLEDMRTPPMPHQQICRDHLQVKSMQSAFNNANEQALRFLEGSDNTVTYDTIMAELRDRLISRLGGWRIIEEPVRHRLPMHPEVFPHGIALQSLLTTPQFEIEGEWYCVENAVGPQDDRWGISLPALANYVRHRAEDEAEQKRCTQCAEIQDLCENHSNVMEESELWTAEHWCLMVLMHIRSLQARRD